MTRKGDLSTALSAKASGNEGGNQPVALAGIKQLLNAPSVKKRFEEVLGKRAPQFMASIVNLVNSDTTLQKCDQMSVISSCMVAATLDLPIDKNLGYMWIVPYKDGKTGRFIAQPQMGYKGYIQLALRTALYRAINAIPVHEGELQKWDPLTEELVIDFTKKKSDAIEGYAGYFELINGFRKSVYWTKEQIISHAKKYSKSYHKESSPWQDPDKFEGMALKTVIRNMLSKWGILSIEMRQAFSEDLDTKLEYGEDPGTEVENIIDLSSGDYSIPDDQHENEESTDENQGELKFE